MNCPQQQTSLSTLATPVPPRLTASSLTHNSQHRLHTLPPFKSWSLNTSSVSVLSFSLQTHVGLFSHHPTACLQLTIPTEVGDLNPGPNQVRLLISG